MRLFGKQKYNFRKEMKKNEAKISAPAYRKYTKEYSMTAVDPSIVWEKICVGNRRPKLTDKIPKGSSYCEYGFDEDGKCLYRKVINEEFPDYNGINLCYVYEGNTIYEIPRSEEAVYHEYHFDDDGKILEIYPREKYEWLRKDVAIVTDVENRRFPSYWLMIQNQEKLAALFELPDTKKKQKIQSYVTGNFINMENMRHRDIKKLKHLLHLYLMESF